MKQVPYLEGLAIRDMLEFAKDYPAAANCLSRVPREVDDQVVQKRK